MVSFALFLLLVIRLSDVCMKSRSLTDVSMIHPCYFQRLPLLEHFKGYETPSASKFPRVAELVKAVDKVWLLLPCVEN